MKRNNSLVVQRKSLFIIIEYSFASTIIYIKNCVTYFKINTKEKHFNGFFIVSTGRVLHAKAKSSPFYMLQIAPQKWGLEG